MKTHTENRGTSRRRRSAEAYNSKLIMAALRLWELKKGAAGRQPRQA